MSFTYTNNNNSFYLEKKVEGNFPIKPTDNRSIQSLTRCARELMKNNIVAGEYQSANMSLIQNSSLETTHRSSQESSWAEDFIDLTEYCQPMSYRMEDTVDERDSFQTTTGRNYYHENPLETANEFEQVIDDNFWPMSSSMVTQNELCDRISDWLSTTKTDSNDINNVSADNIMFTKDEISYDIEDVLSKSHLTPLVPNTSNHQRNENSLNCNVDEASTPTHNECSSVPRGNILRHRNRNNKLLLLESFAQTEAEKSASISNVNFLYSDKSSVSSRSPHSHPPFLESSMSSVERVPGTSAYMPSSLNGSSSSLNVSQIEELNIGLCDANANKAMTSSSKNSDFDIVSYVFEGSKSAVDAAGFQPRTSNDQSTTQSSVRVSAQPAIIIKTEPTEDSSEITNPDIESIIRKHKLEDGAHLSVKRQRKYSICSSEDLTQLESEKYRDLRNKNNEASRRSRANRKTREVELKMHVVELDNENRKLKAKAEKMEKLLKKFRSCLMYIVLKSK